MTINEEQDLIIEKFSQLEDWLDKYEYLVELGRKHEGVDPVIRTDQYALHGCQSQVWIYAQNIGGKVDFRADSDSLIIRGILVLMLKILNQRSPSEIVNADLYFFKRIGLDTALSPSRANGVFSIINNMRHWGEVFSEID